MAEKLFDNLDVNQSHKPQTGTSSNTSGSSVDTQGYNDGLLVVHVGGTLDDADGDETYDIKLQESSDDGSNDSFADTGVSISLSRGSDTNTIKVARIDQLNVAFERYLRANLETGGTTPSIDFSTEIVLGEPYRGPVNDD